MSRKMYIDVNVIQSLPPSCVNRDDTGSPKTAYYGGVRRARVSSQSWKKAVRDSFRENFDGSDVAYRTMKIVSLVSSRIGELDPSLSEEDSIIKAKDVIEKAGVSVTTKTKKKSKGEEESGSDIPEAKALFFISSFQIDNLARLALGGEYSKKDAQEAINNWHGAEISLFGRMVADDPSLNVDASCKVAHAISTHRVDNEYDYYTAVDDRAPKDNAGAGMIGTVEFNSSTMYRYATVAVDSLQRNLGDKDVTVKVVKEFIRGFVMSMPTGKQNTFANHTMPYAVYVAIRGDRPVNLVEAFESPILPDRESGGYNGPSVKRMEKYELEIESDFVSAPIAAWAIGQCPESMGTKASLSAALDGIEEMLTKEL